MSETHRYTTPEGRIWVIDQGLIYGADAEVLTWINAGLGETTTAQLGVAIGVLQEGTAPASVDEMSLPHLLVAGVFFFNHQTGDVSDICVTVAANDIAAARPAVFRKVLDYPFRQLAVRRITAEIDLSNERSVRQAQKLGFRMEGRKRQMGAGGGDVGVFGLLPAECPFWQASVAA